MTVQILDTLIIGAERVCVTGASHIQFDDYFFFKRDPNEVCDVYTSTACHRRYTADYLAMDGFIYLVGLHGLIGIRRSKLIKARWLNCELETEHGLIVRVLSGRIVEQFYRPYEQEPPAKEISLLKKLRLWVTGLGNQTDINSVNERRLELLRYRKALLQVRIEKYVRDSSRYRFAERRLTNTKRNIERLMSIK